MTRLVNAPLAHGLTRLAQRREREQSAGWNLPPAQTPSQGERVIRFALGRVVATPGALRALEKAEQLPAEFLDRHVNGDWGMFLTQTSMRMK
jgi:hypothetical protein